MSEQIDTAIRWGAQLIQDCSESARLDAELLLAHCLDRPRSYLYSWPQKTLDASCWQRYQELVRLRIKPTPVAYLLGSREFYSLEFSSNPSALVPRPETELLVDLALQQCPPQRQWNILELGTGSGIIAITLKKHRPTCRLLASDVDPACLRLAGENAASHAVEIEFVESDWFSGIAATPAFDLIITNPPYIAAQHPFLSLGDLPAEPAIALSPGETGLEALQQIVAGAPARLVSGGYLMMEHGYDQQAALHELLERHGFVDIRCELDASDLPRVSLGRLG